MSIDTNITPKYSLAERAIRTCVFQLATRYGHSRFSLERILMHLYDSCVDKRCTGSGLDISRDLRGIASYEVLGANVTFVTPVDGQASIHMMTLHANELETKIEELGGSWERIILEDNTTVLAIIPPVELTSEWQTFEPHLLRLKWPKQTVVDDAGVQRKVIITCSNAHLVPENMYHTKLFLNCNSPGLDFAMLTAYVGCHVGYKQSVALYNPRGNYDSLGVASEAGHYNDADAVLQQALNNDTHDFDMTNVWVTASCGGCPAAAHLKALYHDQGINTLFQSGSTSIKTDFVQTKSSRVSAFALKHWQGVTASRDIAAEYKPRETGFEIEDLWQDLDYCSAGKVIIVNADNDEILPPNVAEYFLEVAGRYTADIYAVTFHSNKDNAHFDRYTSYAEANKQITEIIFHTSEEGSSKRKDIFSEDSVTSDEEQ